MVYVGSKNRHSKEIGLIIQKYIDKNQIEVYFEPFVGGANMIDKIRCKHKIGNDINECLIELLKYVQDESNLLPETIEKEEYDIVKQNRDCFEKWFQGLVGFCGSFSSLFFNSNVCVKGKRDIPAERIRNIEKQRKSLKGIEFICEDYLNLNFFENSVIYLDPPYSSSWTYGVEFKENDFWEYCRKMSRNNKVYVSNYEAPDDFKCIWQKEVNCSVRVKHSVNDIRIEKLFTI